MAQDWERLGLVGRLWAPDSGGEPRQGAGRAQEGERRPETAQAHLTLPCVSRAGGTMRTAGRAALLAALLLAQLRPGSSQWSREEAAAAGFRDPSLRAGAPDSELPAAGPTLSSCCWRSASRAAGRSTGPMGIQDGR